MRKKTGLTIVERAAIAVPGFETVAKKLEMQVALRGQSKSTLQNYIRRIALFSLHFGRLPEQIEEDEINEYLAALARDPRSPSCQGIKTRKQIKNNEFIVFNQYRDYSWNILLQVDFILW